MAVQDKKKITMKDIAMEMDVSIVTVSKALAGKDGVSEKLRQEILDKAKELGYIYRKSAERGEGRDVAIVISEKFIGEDSFYLKIYQNILLELTQRGFSAILVAVREEEEKNGVLPKLLSLKSIDQMIIIGEISNEFLETVEKTGIICVLFDFENEDYDLDSVIGDNINGGYMLTRHLVQNGCKTLGFVGSYLSTRSNLDRYIGYRKYLIANGIAFYDEYQIPDRDDEGRDIDIVLPEELPDGFVCCCDHTAYRVIRELNKKGYKVPEDVRVVGYDDYADNRINDLKLTTYRVNTSEMITQCMNILEQHCINPEYRHGTSISYGNLIVRETGAVKE
ncbi:transcriptional regulator, LacI family [Eubacterium ruminantium]|nr:transcriptional regulator, LacI family [Eubacterium ruminantium]